VDASALLEIAANVTAAAGKLRDLSAQVAGKASDLKELLMQLLPGYQLASRADARYWNPTDI
jgi:hypothetical protein